MATSAVRERGARRAAGRALFADASRRRARLSWRGSRRARRRRMTGSRPTRLLEVWRERATDRSGLEGWTRAARRAGDRVQLLAAYSKLAAQAEPRRAAACFCRRWTRCALGEEPTSTRRATAFDAAAELLGRRSVVSASAGRSDSCSGARGQAVCRAGGGALLRLILNLDAGRSRRRSRPLCRQPGARVAAEQLNDFA